MKRYPASLLTNTLVSDIKSPPLLFVTWITINTCWRFRKFKMSSLPTCTSTKYYISFFWRYHKNYFYRCAMCKLVAVKSLQNEKISNVLLHNMHRTKTRFFYDKIKHTVFTLLTRKGRIIGLLIASPWKVISRIGLNTPCWSGKSYT